MRGMRFLPIIVAVSLAAGCGVEPAVNPEKLSPLPPFVTEPSMNLEAKRRDIREAAEKLRAEQGPSR
jgi:hypothetical protein